MIFDKNNSKLKTRFPQRVKESGTNHSQQPMTARSGLQNKKCGPWRSASESLRRCAATKVSSIGVSQTTSKSVLLPGFWNKLTWRRLAPFYEGKSMKNDNQSDSMNSTSLGLKLSTIQNIIRSLEIVIQNLRGAQKVIRRNLKEGANPLESGLIKCFLASAYGNLYRKDELIDLMLQPEPHCKIKPPPLRLVSDKGSEHFNTPHFTYDDYR